MAEKVDGGLELSGEGKEGRSVDHHDIETPEETPLSGDHSDAMRKPGSLPVETGNQYVYHKPEKD